MTSRILFKIAGFLLIAILAGCSKEYGTVGPPLEGISSLKGGYMELVAGLAGGAGTADGTGYAARFNSPRALVADGTILFVADQKNNAIRMVDTETGKVTTIAGLPGYSGVADGVGKHAGFNVPEGIDTDGTYLYIADTGNDVIRKLEISTGNVVTLSGKRGRKGATDGAGTATTFNAPAAITHIGSVLYVADTDNNIIRRVDKNTGSTVTIAGTAGKAGSQDGTGPDARFKYPLGIATDGRYLFIADTYNHTIRQLDPETGEVITLGGAAGTYDYKDGSLSESRFHYPYGLTVRGSEIYVADLANEVIRVMDLSYQTVSTISGTPLTQGSADGTAGNSSFSNPADVAIIGDNLYVADILNDTIRKVDIITGATTTLAGMAPNAGSTDGAGDKSRFYTPGGIAKDGDVLYVADTYNHTIRRIDIPTGEVTTVVGTPGESGTADSSESPAFFNSPMDVIVDEKGENIFIVDTDNNVIRKMNLATGEVRTFVGYPGESGTTDGVGRDARFKSPKRGIRIGNSLIIADTGNHTIRLIDIDTRTVSTLAGDPGVAGASDTGQGASGVAKFHSPGDLTTDSDGTFLYVADTGNHAIRKVDLATGSVVTIAGLSGSSGLLDGKNGSALFNSPEGIIWSDGILYISDTGNHLMRRLDISTGEVSFLAGDMSCIEETTSTSGSITKSLKCTGQPSGTSTFGDSTDGTGKTTSFKGPTAISTDGTYLFVMETGGNRIRKVNKDTGETKTFS
ncbi:MAG: hypothetical protein PH343_07800, partial [Nitrospira sp.]|nr:hypothetical protein [Nitrospira sp.]